MWNFQTENIYINKADLANNIQCTNISETMSTQDNIRMDKKFCINRKLRKHLMQNGTGSMEVMDGLAGQSFTKIFSGSNLK